MGKAKNFLEIIQLENTVQIEDNKFSTLNVSGGQRKRLDLMTCFMEDSNLPQIINSTWNKYKSKS